MGWVVSVTPRPALPQGKTPYPLYRRLSGPQGGSGRVRKISPPTGIRSPDRPARSESLYRLSYRGPPCNLGAAAYANIKQLSNDIISVTQQPNLGQGRVISGVLDRPVDLL